MEKIEILVFDIHSLLDKGEHVIAKEKIISAIENAERDSEVYDYFLATVAGLLIDLGAESYDKEATEAGIKILTDAEEFFKSFMTHQSFNYNLGNGMNALYKIQNKDNRLPTLEIISPNLTQAKNCFFKASKEIDFKRIDSLDLQILTNLSNNLSQSGRIIESIRLDNSVLKENENFPQAIVGLAENLDYWIRISFCPVSISLYQKIYSLYKIGLNQKVFPPNQSKYYESQQNKYETLLKESKFDFSTVESEFQQSQREYEMHSAYKKFCIDNFLTLNEHSIFCKCGYSSKDDLSIIHEGIYLYGDKVGKLELLLNRLKSEFSLARELYYEGIFQNEQDDDVIYSDLQDNEVIGKGAEKIRACFRLCFGVFDKIAHGVCYLFDLPKTNRENIYFESFWKSKKCLERWEKLKDIQNPHLVSLYSLANDFNSQSGEFHFYKQWRNKIEHTNLILVTTKDELDIFELFSDEDFITQVPYSFFKEQALHLLQICCAAIFSYSYCVRTESLINKNDNDDIIEIPFVIQPKVNC